jgi:ribokinase
MAQAHKAGVAILGIYVADASYRAGRLPRMGETILGDAFTLGPGGKGANQAVAAARAGGHVTFITKLCDDPFGHMARSLWAEAGIDTRYVAASATPTGSAFIFVDAGSGNNAIIVVPGAGGTMARDDVEAAEAAIAGAAVFVTQLEQPVEAALAGLALARRHDTITIFNPAPAIPFGPEIYPLCDYITPNESEAEALTGIAVGDEAGARKAGDALLAKGVGCALITLGENGALLHRRSDSVLIPAVRVGPVVETTGAGDAFNGGFATALAEGRDPIDAARFACAVAGLSVTRSGAAASMPNRREIDALIGARG